MSSRCHKAVSLCAALPLMCLALGCKREQRNVQVSIPASQSANATLTTELVAGGSSPRTSGPNDIARSAWAVAEGKRLYQAYNCIGCHANGGGAIGPALMDSDWIYGSSLEQIHSTIVQGRPNGMPSFAGKISDAQIWQIAAYVRSMSGQLSSDVAPSRSDHMPTAVPEAARQKEHPGAENPQPVISEPQ